MTIAYGVLAGRVVARTRAGVVAVGDVISDPIFEQPSLNAFMAQGRAAEREVADTLLVAVVPAEPAQLRQDAMTLPFVVGDYVDFYSSIHHATNLGRLFRPDSEPLLPNWKHLPVGYHGRSGTVVVTGTDVVRPTGLVSVDGHVQRRLSARLDIELEVGFVVGTPSEPNQPVAVDNAIDHIFGVVLVNDWSARDIQAFEYQPLGPFLGKSFLTSVSSWVVPIDELLPFRCAGPAQDPAPDAHLVGTQDWGLAIDLEVERNGEVISHTNFGDLYWSFAQQLAHMTSNGAHVRTGDLFASGTVSGPSKGSEGSLIERYDNREFLADGDTIVLRGSAGEGDDRVDLGDVVGTVRG